MTQGGRRHLILPSRAATIPPEVRSWAALVGEGPFAPRNSSLTRPTSEPKSRCKINGPNLLTDFAQSTGSENVGPEKAQAAPRLRAKVNSPPATTLENNGNFRPVGRAENGLAREVGWPNRSGIQPSLGRKLLILLNRPKRRAAPASFKTFAKQLSGAILQAPVRR
jgi:hypothetical protein